MSIKLLPPDNRAPNISFINLNHEVNIDGNVAQLSINDLLSIDVFATDPDEDLIVLDSAAPSRMVSAQSFDRRHRSSAG